MKVRPIVLFVASLVLSVLLCELTVRVLGLGGMMEFEPDPSWGYLMRGPQRVFAYGHPVVINSEGLRGPEIAPTRPNDIKRVLFLGDSITYGGVRIREEELFVRKVEAFLGKTLRVEAVNVSAPGWSPQNWIRFVEKRGLYDADVVVAVIPEVDLARPFGTMELYGLRQNAPPLQLAWFVVQVSSPAGDLWKDVNPEVEARRNLVAVERLIDIADQWRRAVLIVLVPSLPSWANEQRWSLYAKIGVPTVDLRPVLTKPDYFWDGVHLTPAGHEVVAEKIGPAIFAALTARLAG
jgi:lysophospholipase L1-like esterase